MAAIHPPGSSASDSTDPLVPGDPRLDGWYQSIDLGPGLSSKGTYDHRSVLDAFGLPESLAGKRALDVGTADGYFAFEMERRGAAEVVAMDITSWSEVDVLPSIDVSGRVWGPRDRFHLARATLGSNVQYVTCNVYDLSPEVSGTFDFVFCGSLLLHLQNPIRALCNIRSVTRDLAIIETAHDPELEKLAPGVPATRFGARTIEESASLPLGHTNIYGWMNSAALVEMMTYAGFTDVRALEPTRLPPTGHPIVVAHGRAGTELRRTPLAAAK